MHCTLKNAIRTTDWAAVWADESGSVVMMWPRWARGQLVAKAIARSGKQAFGDHRVSGSQGAIKGRAVIGRGIQVADDSFEEAGGGGAGEMRWIVRRLSGS